MQEHLDKMKHDLSLSPKGVKYAILDVFPTKKKEREREREFPGPQKTFYKGNNSFKARKRRIHQQKIEKL